MMKGFELFAGSEIGAATELFLSARNIFEKTGNVPELLVADAAIAHAAVLQPDLAKRTGSVDPNNSGMRSEAATSGCWHGNLSVQAHLNSNLNNYSEAISDSNRSLQLFQELEDMNGVSGVFLQLASLHLFLNDTETSFSYLRRALTIAEMQRAPPTRIMGHTHRDFSNSYRNSTLPRSSRLSERSFTTGPCFE